ncbi:MAG TPA: DUF4159 domain-containing protein [Gemmatimonadaceae bacterium]|nr:DUF4159 domain-containing protein [Gemmatimonadaceae bacterium]
MSVLRTTTVTAALCVVAAGTASAQRRPGGFGQYFGNSTDFYTPPAYHGNPLYDGRFTFARIKYRGYEHMSQEGPGWSHDYPDAEENFTKILRDITAVRPFVEEGPIVGSAIVALDDKALFKYPVSYMSEPGGWHPNDVEIAGFRSYILKGGFMIFDDFREGWRGQYDWTNLRNEVARALPGAKWVQLTGKEPIFDSFFKIDLKAAVSGVSVYGTNLPTYWAVYQDNDPKKRLILMANVDNDIGESWQYSATGFVPIAAANEIYKLGINYIIYALTH